MLSANCLRPQRACAMCVRSRRIEQSQRNEMFIALAADPTFEIYRKKVRSPSFKCILKVNFKKNQSAHYLYILMMVSILFIHLSSS